MMIRMNLHTIGEIAILTNCGGEDDEARPMVLNELAHSDW